MLLTDSLRLGEFSADLQKSDYNSNYCVWDAKRGLEMLHEFSHIVWSERKTIWTIWENDMNDMDQNDMENGPYRLYGEYWKR